MNDTHTALVANLLTGLLRHVLTFGGGATVFSDSELAQFGGALAAGIGLAWSAWRKVRRAQTTM